MNTLVYILFIIMVVIFLNELKNITISFIKTNYFIDISKANLDKNCNNIYSQAETGSFSLAKNSFDILLTNDIFNTKSYYFIILFILILLFIKLFKDFTELNNTDIFGDYDTTIHYILKAIISYYPLIFIVIFGILIISMIAMRNTPNETVGYDIYFKKHIYIIGYVLYSFIVLNIIGYVALLLLMIDTNKEYYSNIIINISFLILLNIYLYLIFNIINIIFTFKNEEVIDDSANVVNKDMSYYTLTNFYKKYFSIIEKDYTTSPESCYNIGTYIVKNIGSLLIYVFVVFIIFIGIFFIIEDNIAIYYHDNILMPLFVFLVLILYIFLFVVFNTDYNKYVIYGVYNSIYKTKLNNLNNVVIPYIKLHQLKATSDSIVNHDFSEQYIITNIIASIINNTLCMTSYNATDDNNISENFKGIKDIIYVKYDFSKESTASTNNYDRKDYDKFKEYYGIVLKNRVGIELMRTNDIHKYITLISKEQNLESDDTKNIWDNFNIENRVNEIPNIHLIDSYIDMYKYKYRFRILKLIKICKTIFNDDNIFNTKFDELKKTYFYIGDKIQYKFLINITNNANYISFIEAYEIIINEIRLEKAKETSIEKETETVAEIETEEKISETLQTSKSTFKKDSFKKILKEDIHQNDFGVLNNDDEFNNYAVHHYAKFLCNLTNDERKDVEDNDDISIRYMGLKNTINNDDKSLYSIIDNFLIISSHLAYNSVEYKRIDNDDDKKTLLDTRDKELFGLIIDNTGENVYNKIQGNTFEYHISEHYYDKSLEQHRIVIKVFTNTVSIKNEVNFTNNYLKQIVSMIYKQLNNEDVKFNNNIENETITFENNIESNLDIDTSPIAQKIINKANNVVSVDFLFIYLFNLILLCLIFYIGNNIDNINFIGIKSLFENIDTSRYREKFKTKIPDITQVASKTRQGFSEVTDSINTNSTKAMKGIVSVASKTRKAFRGVSDNINTNANKNYSFSYFHLAIIILVAIVFIVLYSLAATGVISW